MTRSYVTLNDAHITLEGYNNISQLCSLTKVLFININIKSFYHNTIRGSRV